MKYEDAANKRGERARGGVPKEKGTHRLVKRVSWDPSALFFFWLVKSFGGIWRCTKKRNNRPAYRICVSSLLLGLSRMPNHLVFTFYTASVRLCRLHEASESAVNGEKNTPVKEEENIRARTSFTDYFAPTRAETKIDD